MVRRINRARLYHLPIFANCSTASEGCHGLVNNRVQGLCYNMS